MSSLIRGNTEERWINASWAFRKLLEVLLPALKRRTALAAVAARFEEASDDGTNTVLLGHAFADAAVREEWRAAIDDAVAELRVQGSGSWSEPLLFDEFVVKVGELKNIAG